jgi:hypothetical protein
MTHLGGGDVIFQAHNMSDVWVGRINLPLLRVPTAPKDFLPSLDTEAIYNIAEPSIGAGNSETKSCKRCKNACSHKYRPTNRR